MISIIAFLASLMMPVVKLVLEQAKATKCQSNLRQIGIAIEAYGADQEGMVVRSAFAPAPGSPSDFLHGYLGPYVEASSSDSTSIYDLRQTGTVLWGCPNFRIDPSTPWYTGYGFNAWLKEPVKDPNWRRISNAWLGSDWTGNWLIGVFQEFQLGGISFPSQRPLVGEGDVDWTIGYRIEPTPRHSSGKNLLYVDGHVGSVQPLQVYNLVINPQ